ncbi:hypothetical protein GOP47_0018485 [Adiantum capillus-veneris]|uniref:La-related protein 6 n=1 Tax=Adiantum capillus-veneris TaxID=13818 RepID=A0A9D4ZAR4_ADICA|nr:hypothetical protein GOP47_0018485 [Adiantum capillus-veneris]
MDPPSHAPPAPDPVVATASSEVPTHPENAELLSRDPTRLSSGASRENRASLQKSIQPSRPSTQSRNVQWVRVTPQSQKAGNSSTHETGDSGKQGSSGSLSTAVPQNQPPSSTELLELAAAAPTVMSQKQATEVIKVVDECGSVESSSKTSHDQTVVQSASNENIAQEVVVDNRVPDPVIQAMEEELMPPATNPEDEQILEPQQRSLSRTSSLSAKAREFVPKNVTMPTAAPTLPPQPPQMHGPLMPPLMIPLNTAPGILSMFPPSSPLPSPQLGGFPIPMAGPPPPPIPASLMGPMPILGPPHPGLLNVGPPPPPVIPPSPYLIHSPSSSVPSHLPSATLVDSLIDPLANQSVRPSGEVAQDQQQSQDPDLSAAQPGTTKPVLTEELRAKIVKQVEFYFSDTNLPTDHHLMKFVKKDSEGFVPIAILANFRKVRNLVKNYALVASALRSSKQLVVSTDGKKVRRLHPLPPVDLEEIQSRTVVAENLPDDHSIESMEQLFSSVGNVKMIRVCEPEASNGTNQAAKFSKADMVVSNKLHALVEYETVEQAERAVAELTDQGNWRRGLHVRLLLRRTNKHNASKSHKVNEGADGSGPEDDAATSASDNVVDRGGEEGNIQDRSEELPGGDNAQLDGSSKKGRGRGRVRGRGRGQYHPNGGRSHPVGTPPQANMLSNFEVKPPLGPRMPDGTRGFTLGRGKVMPTNSV